MGSFPEGQVPISRGIAVTFYDDQRHRVGLRACPMSLYRGDLERNMRRRGGRWGVFVIFVWISAIA